MSKTLYIWYIQLCVNLIAFYLLYHYQIVHWVIANDVTYITSVIVAIYFSNLLLMGHITKNIEPFKKIDRQYEVPWFVSEQILGLGLLGTVIGFMYMLSGDLINTKLQDTDSVIKLMSTMSLSMGTALLTTATGLIASILLKSQIVLLVRLIKNEL